MKTSHLPFVSIWDEYLKEEHNEKLRKMLIEASQRYKDHISNPTDKTKADYIKITREIANYKYFNSKVPK